MLRIIKSCFAPSALLRSTKCTGHRLVPAATTAQVARYAAAKVPEDFDRMTVEEKQMFLRDQQLIRNYIKKHPVSTIVEHQLEGNAPEKIMETAGLTTTDIEQYKEETEDVQSKIKKLEETISSLKSLVERAKAGRDNKEA